MKRNNREDNGEWCRSTAPNGRMRGRAREDSEASHNHAQDGKKDEASFQTARAGAPGPEHPTGRPVTMQMHTAPGRNLRGFPGAGSLTWRESSFQSGRLDFANCHFSVTATQV